MKERRLINLLISLLAISILFNINNYIQSKDEIKQLKHQNDQDLWSISISGNNLANRLENFLRLIENTEVEDKEELHAQLTDSWRIVLGERESISFYLSRISPYLMGEMEIKWSLLQFGLLRINTLVHRLNINFLEQGNLDITAEEEEQLEAVIEVYRKLYEEVESGSNNPILVIDELTEQMMVIDPNYAGILDRLEQN